MNEMRDYQATAIESALRALTTSGSAILQMPTEAGKTRCAAEIVANYTGVVWFICHRREIERQTARAFEAAGIDFGIVSPRAEPDYSKRVQIVSIDSIRNRMADMPAPGLVIWDECHHVAADTWATVREALTETLHLGLTATPERMDGKGLREWFAELVVGPSVKWLVEQGFLSDFRYFAPSEPDLAAARMQAGDYHKKDIDAAMNTPVIIGDAVAEYRRLADGKRAVAFCTSVEASVALAERFNAEGIPARHVDGDTPDLDRAAAIAALASGEIKVLSNVLVLTEGVDVPGIEAAILLRPTKSPTLFLQMVGRALRPVEGKVAVIMDHGGLWLDHKRPDVWRPWNIDGGAAKALRAASGRGPRRCPECKEVREERVEVCACGFVFPTGREVGEFDGVLREVPGEIPEGCETIAEFARRYGVSWTLVKIWVRKGLPCVSTYINVADGDAWVSDNVDKSQMLLAQGRVSVGEGEISITKFAAMIGMSDGAVHRLIRTKGLPTTNSGKICLNVGVQWVGENRDVIDRIKAVGSGMRRPPEGFMSMNRFAKRHGRHSAPTVELWVGLGLPHDGRFIPIDDGDDWVRANEHRLPSAVRLGSLNRASKKLFGKFLGFNGGHSLRVVNSLVAAGLPCDPKLGIPIQAALEWVRDNRPDIVVPPEAWPTPVAGNDNTPDDRADAA